ACCALSPPARVCGPGTGAPQPLDEAARNRQAQPDADAGVVVAEPLERSEQLVLGAPRYARALVDDGDQNASTDLARRDPHRALLRVAQRVVNQVGEHSLQQ